ncbi:DUF4230 domain-containing protein [Ammonicoccus fulvus]|uniref:DUF4230 domain-containing protein n=1 Tax=Ammonicoccus fulvus TaxID=3138240 RepID=A0ABZ3FSR3_9ACTN
MIDPDTLPRSDVRFRVAVGVAALLLVALVVRSLDPFGWFVPGVEESPAAAGDVTVLEIREAAELKAASGTFSVPVVIDVEKTGLRSRLPDFVDGETIVAIYQGDVDATIDLRGLTEDGITADPETRTITVRVPAPVLSRPSIDHDKSRIVSHSRGVVQRLDDALGNGSLAVKEDMDAAAVTALARAADESDLRDTARTQGTHFLTLLCQQLGYEHITIEYAEPPR